MENWLSLFPSLPMAAFTVVVAVAAHVSRSFLSNVLHNRKFITRRIGSIAVEPPRVFSVVPHVGAGAEMSQGILKFIRKYSQKLDSPIFSALVGGKLCHFFAASEDATVGFWQTPKLDQTALGMQFMANAIGMSHDNVMAAYNNKHQMKKVFSLIQKHVLAKDAMAVNVDATQEVLKKRFEALDQRALELAETGEWLQMSLFDFALFNIFAAAIGPLISYSIATDEAAQNFRAWDKGIPLLFGGVPGLFLRNSIWGRDELLKSILKPEFVEQASEMMKARRQIYIDDFMFGQGALSIIFASAGNSYPSVFWTMIHVLSNLEALEAVVQESRSFQPDSKTGFFTIEQLDQMVVIKSVWYEAIRLYLFQFSARDVVKDIEYETKAPQGQKQIYLLKAGTRIMPNLAIRHHDPDVFDDPEQFQWDRFVPDPKTGKPPVFTTKDGEPIDEPVVLFGGGTHKCPGRFFIEYEMKSFLANVFSKYDVRLAEGASIPASVKVETGVGIVAPQDDVMIKLKKRG